MKKLAQWRLLVAKVKAAMYASAAALLALMTVPLPAVAFSGPGAGTSGNPFLIANCVQLQEMADDLDAYYKLANTIDCADTSNWNGFKGFNPVGDDSTPFTGTLDGGGYTIQNMFIDRSDDSVGEGVNDESYVGIIGYLNGGTIKDLRVTNSKVKGYVAVGGVVGYATGGVIQNVHFNVGVANNTCAPGVCVWARWGEFGGGIIGQAVSGTQITNVQTGGPVKGSGNTIGGIVGQLADSSLIGATAAGNVDGGYDVGGIVGRAVDSTITNAHATGDVLGQRDDLKPSSQIGGFAGELDNTTVSNASARGNVESSGDHTGGFVGISLCGSNISNSFATGDVVGADNTGGFSGYDSCSGLGSTFEDAYATGNVTGEDYIGGFVGFANMSQLNAVHATGQVNGVGAVGGLVGSSFGDNGDDALWTYISDAYATGAVSGDYRVGGLIGQVDSGTLITRSYAHGAADGVQYVGGFAGYIIFGEISQSFARGAVSGEDFNIGGFAGEIIGGTVSDAYSHGDVTVQESFAGGFIGTIYGGTVERVYAAGNVTIPETGAERAGAFASESYEDSGNIEIRASFAVGRVEAPAGEGGFIANLNPTGMVITGNYFDIARTGHATCTAGGDNAGCTGVNVDYSQSYYFINNSTNAPLNAWDFDAVWQTQAASYPCLRWEGNGACLPQDTDRDGHSDFDEDSAPNNGDANGDLALDSQQPNVASYVNPVTSQFAALEVPEECTIQTVSSASEASKPAADIGFDYPLGLMSFRLECATPGFTAAVGQYYYNANAANLVPRKYNSANNSYQAIADATVEQVTVATYTVAKATYQLTDGGALDEDAAANGTIIDPAGPAATVISAPNTGLGGDR